MLFLEKKKNRFLLQKQMDKMGRENPYTQVHVTEKREKKMNKTSRNPANEKYIRGKDNRKSYEAAIVGENKMRGLRV